MSYTQPLCLCLLNKCKTLTSVKQIHANLLKSGHQSDHIIAGKFLLHCAVTLPDSLEHACSLFRYIPEPDRFMYNTLIRGLAEAERPQLSLVIFIEMTRRRTVSPPDSFSFAFVLKAVANLRYLTAGIQLHSQALTHGLHAHIFVGTTLISMYGECGCSGLARKVFDEMAQPNVVAWNAVITACFRSGDVKAATELFDAMPFKNLTSWNVMLAGYLKAGELKLARKGFMKMPRKDDVSWSTMIVGLVHHECFEGAFGFFRELHRERKLRPNEASLTGVLSACAQAGAFEFGKIIHGFIEKSGFAWIISVNNALLDTYSKCGNMGMARLIFERIPNQRNLVSWTSMMVALAMHGYGNEAIEVFRKMEESGIRPDGITFISLLYACSHAGLVEQGCGYFNRMRSVYNIEPAIEHYGCMVDLYSRAGQLFKAYEFVCQMPVPPNDIIWRTLLGACSIHGNVKLAEQVKEKLAELDPNNSGDHVLLSNIYAVAGKWKDVATVRRSMTRMKIQKYPGWSMIEVDKTMYTFLAGAKQDNIREEAYEKLKQVILRLMVEGSYVPEVGGVLYDIEEEEKEDSLTTHSEKLALAFGIARMRVGKTVKIVKNLRICRDCHAFFKMVSRIYNLEIVVRDRNRFHSFVDGCCSCSDYW